MHQTALGAFRSAAGDALSLVNTSVENGKEACTLSCTFPLSFGMIYIMTGGCGQLH